MDISFLLCVKHINALYFKTTSKLPLLLLCHYDVHKYIFYSNIMIFFYWMKQIHVAIKFNKSIRMIFSECNKVNLIGLSSHLLIVAI